MERSKVSGEASVVVGGVVVGGAVVVVVVAGAVGSGADVDERSSSPDEPPHAVSVETAHTASRPMILRGCSACARVRPICAS